MTKLNPMETEMKLTSTVVILLALVAVLAGCQDEKYPISNATDQDSPPVDGSKFLLDSEPEDAHDVIAARVDAKDGDEIVLVGRIGGGPDPWIDGRAAFTIVDASLKPCNELEGDDCPVPLDYCCETSDLSKATALVKVMDADGTLVKADARKLLNVKELATVVVQGKAHRDDAGNFIILATGVYVKK